MTGKRLQTYETDSLGWQHRELERAGLTLLNYDDVIRGKNLKQNVSLQPGDVVIVR